MKFQEKSLGEKILEEKVNRASYFDPESLDQAAKINQIDTEYVPVLPSKIRGIDEEERYKGRVASRSEIFDEQDFSQDSFSEEYSDEVSESEADIELEVGPERLANNLQLRSSLLDEINALKLAQPITDLQSQISLDKERGNFLQKISSDLDGLVELRISFQKGLELSNQLPLGAVRVIQEDKKFKKQLGNLREELLILNSSMIDALQRSAELNGEGIKTVDFCTRKRKRFDDPAASQAAFDDLSKIDDLYYEFACRNLDKWNEKSRINFNKKFKVINQGIHAQISQTLADREKFIGRTRLMRREIKILFKEKLSIENYSDEIFDDNDFYQNILREYAETRAQVLKSLDLEEFKKNERKTQNRITKDRVIKYDIHEKLVNFMVPINTSQWNEEKTQVLFNSLFGKQCLQ